MKFDPLQHILNTEDEEIVDGDWCREQGYVNTDGTINLKLIPKGGTPQMLSVGNVCIRAILAPPRSPDVGPNGQPVAPPQLTGDVLLEKDELARKIRTAMKGEQLVDVESEEIVLLKKYILPTYNNPIVYPFMHKLLEQKDAAQPDRSEAPAS